MAKLINIFFFSYNGSLKKLYEVFCMNNYSYVDATANFLY